MGSRRPKKRNSARLRNRPRSRSRRIVKRRGNFKFRGNDFATNERMAKIIYNDGAIPVHEKIRRGIGPPYNPVLLEMILQFLLTTDSNGAKRPRPHNTLMALEDPLDFEFEPNAPYQNARYRMANAYLGRDSANYVLTAGLNHKTVDPPNPKTPF